MIKVIKNSDIRKIYTQQPSLAEYLPWQDYNDKYKLFLLEDNQSLAAGFEFIPIPCEARPAKMMEDIAKSFSEALKNAIPCEKLNPWILQLYIERSRDFEGYYQQVEEYVDPARKDSEFTKAHLNTLKKHFEFVSRKDGIFFDQQVTNQIFKGGILRAPLEIG